MELALQFVDSLNLGAIGALASVGGLFVALVGFFFTLKNVSKSERAAVRAEKAATDAVEKIKLFDSVSGFSSAISILEEIKRFHRKDAWEIVLDRYAALTRILIDVRASNAALSNDHNKIVQLTITHISTMEKVVESALEKSEKPSDRVAKFNAMLSKDIMQIQELLVEIKSPQKD